MDKQIKTWWASVVLVVLTITLLTQLGPLQTAGAQDSQPAPAPAASSQPVSPPGAAAPPLGTSPASKGYPVVLGQKTLFRIQTSTSTMYASQRAQLASQEIKRIAGDRAIPLENITARANREVFIIFQKGRAANNQLILVVSNGDAQIANLPLNQVATTWLKTIKEGIKDYRREHSQKRLLFRIAALVASTFIYIAITGFLNRLATILWRRLQKWFEAKTRPIGFKNLEIITVDTQSYILQRLFAVVRWLVLIALAFSYFLTIAFFFPQTEQIGRSVINLALVQLGIAGSAFINYLPSLFTILVVVLLARFVLKILRLIFDALEAGTVLLPGFYKEWTRPTHHLLTIIVWAASLAIIYSYLPGNTSPAFQGLGLLLGALLTVGGAGTVSSLISGYVIIFSRAFQKGDLIGFEDFKGFVHETTLLATQIRSLNGEIMTIPNGSLQSKTIVNFSAIIRDLHSPLTLQTSITLGYDVPWRQVHRVLAEAALATDEVLADPAPFVLQTSLQDFYVSYTLKVFINTPENIPRIYSELLQNIQDHCAKAGIEITSPHYAAIRNGNKITIPTSSLDKAQPS
jgi:small-conductance mechanosensitive channel